MLVCRNAWQRLAPLTQRGTAALLRNAPARQMSASSVPGSSGASLPYYAFVGVAMAGAGFYVYRTLSRDKARFHERHEYIQTQLKPQLNSIKEGEDPKTSAATETIEEAVEAAIEEAAAEEIAEQEVVLVAAQEEQQPVTEVDAPKAPEEELVVSSEASAEQVENIEPVLEVVAAEISPVLEASSENITEEVAAASEDWSELSARKPEDAGEESSPAVQESEEAVEVAASS